jgi:hypothetical protein
MMVNDKKLRQHLADARSAHDDAFTWSTSSYSARAIQEQTDAARGGVSAIDGALTRIGELSRKYG